ncbi:MAG: hypothetical protein WB797_10980, partial [Nocardioides sp.]
WWGALLAQPALLTVPVAFATMVGVSLADQARVPVHVGRAMVRLHLPETVEVDRGSYRPSEGAPRRTRGGPPQRARSRAETA